MPSTERARPLGTPLRVVQTTDAHEVLAYSNVIIVVWYQPPRADLVRQLYLIGEQTAIEQGVPKVSVVSLVPRPFRAAPSATARAALAELHRDPKHVLHRMALVFVGEGFVLASIRSILLSIRSKLMGSSNSEIFKNLDDAVDWATAGLVGPGRQSVTAAPIVTEVNRHLVERNEHSMAS